MTPRKLQLKAKKEFLTSAEEIQRLWRKYFPGILLTKTEWFQIYEPKFVKKGMRIAAQNRRGGKKFFKEDEKNIGKYVVGIIRNLVQGKPRPIFLAMATVYFPASYQITEEDKSRFRAKLTPSGDHLLFGGVLTKSGYKKFWVNRRSRGAHLFAFFEAIGRLPDPNDLGGQNGLQIAHQCGVRHCCNPSHLCLTTKAVNLWQRGSAGEASNLPTETCGIDPTRYGSSNGMSPGTAQGQASTPPHSVYPHHNTHVDSMVKPTSRAEFNQSEDTEEGLQQSSLSEIDHCLTPPSDSEMSIGGVSL